MDNTAFSAGFARVDITPPLGSFMPGYYEDRRAKAVFDPLQINMVAFSDGRTTALVAQYDTVGLSDSVADLMRDAIARATGIDRDAIILHASHTHDGGYLSQRAGRGPEAAADSRATEIDRLYVDFCVARSADAAVEAVADLRPASLSFGRSVARRISFVRCYLMKNGCHEMELTTEVARAERIRAMADHADFHDIPLFTLAIGPDLAFCGFPGEPFNEIGVAIRKASPFKLTIVSCLTNGKRGYFPFSDSYRQGGYEAATSPFGPSVADDLIAGQLRQLRAISNVIGERTT